MRDLTNDTSLLSQNAATVRKQWNPFEIIEGCTRHEFGSIAPWRDQVEDIGLVAAARQIRDAGLTITGLCRGRMFPALDKYGFQVNIEDSLKAIVEAVTLGAECLFW